MKGKTLIEGHNGNQNYKVGDVLDDSEHLRQLLANGLAMPADDAAENFMEDSPHGLTARARYMRAPYLELAKEVRENQARARAQAATEAASEPVGPMDAA